jgi:ethanolamine ammonia-lyase large subunit
MNDVALHIGQRDDRFNVQILVSDRLNALSILDPGHLEPFLSRLRNALRREGFRPAPENLVFTSGHVRAGYRVGESLFGGLDGPHSIIHLIGERPGTGHRTFSAYLTTAPGAAWKIPGKIDHDITKVVSGIASTAMRPSDAADETVRLLSLLRRELNNRFQAMAVHV